MAQRDVARSTELSGSVPGLNPGFEVVLLGFCRSGESAVQRRLLKAYHPFIYERPVTQAVSACPKWKEAGGERVLQEPAMLKVGLSGVTLTRVVSRLQPPVSLCNFLPSDTTRTVVKWDGQKLVEEDKVIEKRELNYDRDCAE
ncbi:hypothetical protein [Myxococcus fulvus]|uniref:hypothetical protein n=1 Tax=Myxococcus fulvus TaxID=33 RepID=UPI0020BD4920|nr:hypothetical protein [Myxococcus fulvus]MCK8501574.1 hypothetical protein [Myxococcus fulvus]